MFSKNKKIFIIVFITFMIFLGILIYFYFINNYTNKEDFNDIRSNELEIADSQEEPKKIVKNKCFIDVKGAVVKPGVYEVDEDTIINEAIKKAGGFKSNAYKNNINLSKKVSNEMVIYVYTNYEYQKNNINNDTNSCKTNDYNIDSCKNSSVIETTAETTSNKEEDNNTIKIININKASLEELETIPGIKGSKAKSIIEYRNNNGYFNTIDDITKVTGIGTATYEKIKNYITV